MVLDKMVKRRLNLRSFRMNQPFDIRWYQRLQNFRAAFNELDEAVQLSQARPLSKLEEQGLIQAREYTYELAENTIKDF